MCGTVETGLRGALRDETMVTGNKGFSRRSEPPNKGSSPPTPADDLGERSCAEKSQRGGGGLERTQYGQYAEQDGYQGVHAHSHPPGAGFALRGNPPGVTPTRLQHNALVTHELCNARGFI